MLHLFAFFFVHSLFILCFNVLFTFSSFHQKLPFYYYLTSNHLLNYSFLNANQQDCLFGRCHCLPVQTNLIYGFVYPPLTYDLSSKIPVPTHLLVKLLCCVCFCVYHFILYFYYSQTSIYFSSYLHLDIFQIREKTERSIPLASQGYRFGGSNNDSASDQDDALRSRSRSRMTRKLNIYI